MKVFTFICVHAWETNTYARVNLYEMSTYKSCWSVDQACACWDMVARGIVLKFPDWQSNVHFPWPNELTICPDINGFQIPLKTSCTGHRLRKAKQLSKRLLCFLFRENLLGIVSRLLFFCFTSSVSGALNKCPNSHHNHSRHPFITWM